MKKDINWFIREGLLAKTPFIQKLAPRFVEKAKKRKSAARGYPRLKSRGFTPLASKRRFSDSKVLALKGGAIPTNF